jgi:hypothetical protein
MKGNRGNTRTGSTRSRGHGRPTRTVWRRDILIRERMSIVQRCWRNGLTMSATLNVVNEWASVHVPSHPYFTITTIKNDRNNIAVLAYERRHRVKTAAFQIGDYDVRLPAL